MKMAGRLSQLLIGRKLVSAGNALQGRLFHIALDHAIPFHLNTPVVNLIVEEDRATGVLISHEGQTKRLKANRGVLINASGFPRNSEMREKYQPFGVSAETSHANPGNTGDLIQIAQGIGADVEYMREAWWLPSSRLPNGVKKMHVFDRSKPNCIMVDHLGNRFMNEACSYMEVGQKMIATGGKCWLIFDQRHASRYPMVMMMNEGYSKKKLIELGYYKYAKSVEDLARQCDIEPSALKKTINHWNRMCRTGFDQDFKKGERYYDCYYGDKTIKPNACMGPIEKSPYYAIEIFPGDVGIGGGILTDHNGCVIKIDGSVIGGLYAAGNGTASVMGDKYLGAGASIGDAMVFSLAAAEHAIQNIPTNGKF